MKLCNIQASLFCFLYHGGDFSFETIRVCGEEEKCSKNLVVAVLEEDVLVDGLVFRWVFCRGLKVIFN